MPTPLPWPRVALLTLLIGCCTPTRAQTAESPQNVPPAILPAAQPPSPTQPDQAAQPAPIETEAAPLPDIPAMMHEVEANQRKAEAIEKNYIFHSVETEQELDSHEQVKKTRITEADHYWVNGVPVRRVVKRDGKPLSAEDQAREDKRVENQSARASERRAKADAEGKETDPRGEEEITVSRLLELGSFTNPRRVELNGRPTIAVDYAGDPQARTRNRAEDVIRDLEGTAWVDERDHVLVRAEGHFANAFKIGAGLIADIHKDTRFSMEQTKVNDEVWLPAHIEAQGDARMLLFFNFNGSIHADFSDYRKFRATSTVLPGFTQVDTPTPAAEPTAKP